jgi:hypothetical protein
MKLITGILNETAVFLLRITHYLSTGKWIARTDIVITVPPKTKG